MFGKLRLTKNLQVKYSELFIVNKEIEKLERSFNNFYKKNKNKKYTKELKHTISRLLKTPNNLSEIHILNGNKSTIENSLLKINNKDEELIYRNIINEIHLKLGDRKYDYVLPMGGERVGNFIPSMFNILYEVPYINKFSKISEEHKKLIDNMFKKINASDIKEQVLIFLILLKNIKNIIGLEDNYKFLSNIIYSLNIADSEIKYEQLLSLFEPFWRNELNIEENNLKDIINILLDEININYHDRNKEMYLNDLIKNIIGFKEILNISSETLKVVIDKIKNYTEYNENKKKNIEYILYQLVPKYEFINLSNDIQIKLINTIMNLELKNEDNMEMIDKIINDIILCNENIELVNYVIDKLSIVKSVKSLELLNDIYPFVKKYSNEEEIVNVINTIEDNKVKKLVINIKE